MTKVIHGYAIGLVKVCDLSDDYYKLVTTCTSRQDNVLERLLLKDIVLHTKSYHDGEGTRRSTYCS